MKLFTFNIFSKPNISNLTPPSNYQQIDNYVSRSAQPDRNQFLWLKEEKRITDVINLRSDDYIPELKQRESKFLEKLNINYNNIHLYPGELDEPAIEKIFKVINNIREAKGVRNVLVHCTHGADRTGLISFLYKQIHNLDSFNNCKKEMIVRGFNYQQYPNLFELAEDYLKRIKI